MEQNRNPNTKMSFDDCAKMTDFLNCEKHMTGVYNSFLCETETTAVRGCLTGLLSDEHHIQEQLFGEMKNRGWYQTTVADQSKLNEAKQKYAPKANMS